MISTLKNFVIFGLDLDVLNKQLENIHAIDAKQLQELAQQYLNFDKMTKIVAG
jgi:predicted Zn-dependent peptidase